MIFFYNQLSSRKSKREVGYQLIRREGITKIVYFYNSQTAIIRIFTLSAILYRSSLGLVSKVQGSVLQPHTFNDLQLGWDAIAVPQTFAHLIHLCAIGYFQCTSSLTDPV